MSEAFIGIGSNQGDSKHNILRAMATIGQLYDIKIEKTSGLYKTEPVGYTRQPDFLNSVIQVKTTLSPSQLLSACLETEQKMGRRRQRRWGPRIIDLDILTFDDIIHHDNKLDIPHPEIAKRRFVLVPFAEIKPDKVIPEWNQKVEKLLSETRDSSAVTRVMNSSSVWNCLKRFNRASSEIHKH